MGLRKCLLCNESIESTENVKTVELEDGSTYMAHESCISALQMLLSRKFELPPKEELTSKDLIYSFYTEGWFSTARSLSD